MIDSQISETLIVILSLLINLVNLSEIDTHFYTFVPIYDGCSTSIPMLISVVRNYFTNTVIRIFCSIFLILCSEVGHNITFVNNCSILFGKKR